MKVKKILKKITLAIISILPGNNLRIFLFKHLFKYNIDNNTYISSFVFLDCIKCEIKNTKINSFNLIKVQEVSLDNAFIEKKNIFKDFKLLKFKNKINIGTNNKIYGNYPLSQNSNFIIEDNCIIGSNNFFDLSNNIIIKNKCEISDFCQIWTHGFNSNRNIFTGEVFLNNEAKIENCVTVISNVEIANNCIIKIGSIVTKSILTEGIYSSNQLIKKSN